MNALFQKYHSDLSDVLMKMDFNAAQKMAEELDQARSRGCQVFLCGNGGSAANAIHWANDLIFGAGRTGRGGLRVHALPANAAISTCLANDLSYEEVFSEQLRVLGSKGDILLVFSGSGNSPNILNALKAAREIGIQSWAVLGFDGGKARELADNAIHFPAHDMQIAEDCQMILGHMVTRFLAAER